MAPSPAFLLVAVVTLAATLAAVAAEHRDEYAGDYAEASCDDPPSPSSSSTTAAAFRADLLALLAALPAAAAPTGFASLRRSNAFARGLCYGASPPALQGSSCAACLSGAARKAAGCAGSGSRRGGVWSPGCSLAFAFADTNASSPNEASYRACLFVFSPSASDADPRSPAFYDDARALSALALSLAPQAASSSSGPMLATAATDMAATQSKQKRIKVHAVAQCARDRAAADCGECLGESARELPRCWGREAGRSEGVAAVSVVGYNCYLRLEMYAPAPPFSKILWTFVKNNAVVFILLAVIVGTVPLAGVACVLGRRFFGGAHAAAGRSKG